MTGARLAAAIAAVCLAAGCGGGTKTVTEVRSGTTTTSTKSKDACKRLVDLDQSGRCESQGTTFAIAVPGDTQRISELAGKLLGVQTANQVSGEGGSARARGTFVIARVALTNRTTSPQDLGTSQDQTEIIVGDKDYSEDFNAENGAVSDSFVSQAPLKIQPDETIKGAYVYDVPPKVATKIRRGRGGLGIVNFSDADVSGNAKEALLLRFGTSG